jgi:hypothetical protein
MNYCINCQASAPLGGGECVHMPWCDMTPRMTYEDLAAFLIRPAAEEAGAERLEPRRQ